MKPLIVLFNQVYNNLKGYSQLKDICENFTPLQTVASYSEDYVTGLFTLLSNVNYAEVTWSVNMVQVLKKSIKLSTWKCRPEVPQTLISAMIPLMLLSQLNIAQMQSPAASSVFNQNLSNLYHSGKNLCGAVGSVPKLSTSKYLESKQDTVDIYSPYKNTTTVYTV